MFFYKKVQNFSKSFLFFVSITFFLKSSKFVLIFFSFIDTIYIIVKTYKGGKNVGEYK